MVDAASSGAWYGTLLDREVDDGVQRTQEMIDRSLPLPYSRSVTAHETTVDGVATLEIRVEGSLTVLGTLGFENGITVSGHAVRQMR